MAYVKREIEELINSSEPAWPLVLGWVKEAKHPVEILPPSENACNLLVSVQVTTRSPLGALIFHSGGILIDHGWLRLLGSGHPRLPRSLPAWNFACGMKEANEPPPWLLIADDVLGGFFALNGGRFAAAGHTVWYFAPDTLEWEDTEKSYTDFLYWCVVGDLEHFYIPYRWAGWERDVAALRGDEAFAIYPPLTTDDPPIDQRRRTTRQIAALFGEHIGAV